MYLVKIQLNGEKNPLILSNLIGVTQIEQCHIQDTKSKNSAGNCWTADEPSGRGCAEGSQCTGHKESRVEEAEGEDRRMEERQTWKDDEEEEIEKEKEKDNVRAGE